MFLCIFPALLTGTHSKKQGEDLSDNDGDEDEGIRFGDERQLHVLDFFSLYFECSPPFCIFLSFLKSHLSLCMAVEDVECLVYFNT